MGLFRGFACFGIEPWDDGICAVVGQIDPEGSLADPPVSLLSVMNATDGDFYVLTWGGSIWTAKEILIGLGVPSSPKPGMPCDPPCPFNASFSRPCAAALFMTDARSIIAVESRLTA